MTSKEQYRQLCKTEATISVFQTDWWLDAVVGENSWDVILSFNDGKPIGALPYFSKQRFGFKIITMPRFISMMGIWIKYPSEQKHIDKLHYEQKITEDILRQLPDFDYFNQSFYPSFQNWLPFHWRGFSQTTRYTYRINNLQDLDTIYKNFAHSKRKNIARSEPNLIIKEDLSAKDFYLFHKKCLQKEGKKIDYSLDLISSMIHAGEQNAGGKVIYAVDTKNEIHSALFTVWNKECAFNLINPIDPDHRISGASTLLVKEMIRLVQNKTKTFDFEGSMDKAISESFRRFGAIQTPYFVLSKSNSKFYNLLKFFKR